MTLMYEPIDTVLGQLTLVWDDTGLKRLLWPGQSLANYGPGKSLARSPFRQSVLALLNGTLQQHNCQLSPEGTAFQKSVWLALGDIPRGHTWSYQQVAHHIGKPDAARAVGAAIGRNPLPVVLPCHRVVGSDGQLTGFSGGLALKRWLLESEGVVLHPLRDRLT